MEKKLLDEFKKFLAETKRVSARTQYRYIMAVRDLDFENLTQESLNKHVQKKLNDSVVRGAILNLLEWAGLHKTFDMPPKATGRIKKRVYRDISHAEIIQVRDYLYKESFRKGLMFDLVYQGALRRFEVPTIRLNSFKWLRWFEDISKPCHLIIAGKGNKERVVLINSETAEMILEHYKRKYAIETEQDLLGLINSNSLVFTSKDGKPLSDWVLWKVIKKGSIKALGRDIRTHELRHERASELESLGVPIRDIKNYLGHSSLATTEIYLHRSEKESIDNIQNILESKNQNQ